MPLSATYELLILSQVPFQDICPIQLLVNKLMIFSLSTSSLYHLTAIAWERKMAVKSWIKYRNNVTERRLTGLAIAAWLFGVITPGPPILMVVAGVHRKFISIWLVGKIVSMIGCLAAIGYFYFMIFLEVRKRDRNQIGVVSPNGMVNPSRVLSSKSWDNRAKGNISNSRQKSQLNETTRRPKTAPSNVIHPNEKTAQHKVLKKSVTNCPECPF